MKIISGIYRGRTIETLSGQATRPTLNRVRENVFNLIRFDLTNETKVLDLFAGSGAISLEFASNQVQQVVAIEKSYSAYQVIMKNISKINGANKKIEVYLKDYKDFLKNNRAKFNIVYIDPPYDFNYEEIVKQLVENNCLEAESKLIFESDKQIDFKIDGFSEHKVKKYGKIYITIFMNERE